MKFKQAIIAILTLIFVVNAIGVGFLVKEEQKQTTIALKTAELISIQTDDIYNHDTVMRIRKDLGLSEINAINVP